MKKKLKKIYLIFLFIVLLYITQKYFVSEDNIFSYEEFSKNIKDDRIINKKIFISMKLNDVSCSYDEQSDTCYFYDVFDEEKKFKVKMYTYDNSPFVSIDGINLNYINFDYKGDNFILIYNNNFYYEIKVKFVSIPIINIHQASIKKAFISNRYNEILADSFQKDEDVFFQLSGQDNRYSVHQYGQMHIRGSTSFFYEKKSYKVELTEKINILKMDSDDDWVLDSLYNDSSKVRNKLSSDMWNLINDNQVINNDLYSNYVELFIDNEYIGLYTIKDKVDKSKCNVSSDGLLAMTIDHANTLFIDNITTGNVKYDEENNLFGIYEMKYFNDLSLKNFENKLKTIYGNKNDYNLIDNSYFMNNYLNYKILISLIMGNDNVTKNQYYSMQKNNSKILITPWDMDLTWGSQYYDSNKNHSLFVMNSCTDIDWLNNNITNNMDLETLNALKKRYWELRKNVITMDTINSYLDSYKELLVESGAAKRDSEKWYNYDIEFEIEQIREWASNRIAFLDEYFKI